MSFPKPEKSRVKPIMTQLEFTRMSQRIITNKLTDPDRKFLDEVGSIPLLSRGRQLTCNYYISPDEPENLKRLLAEERKVTHLLRKREREAKAKKMKDLTVPPTTRKFLKITTMTKDPVAMVTTKLNELWTLTSKKQAPGQDDIVGSDGNGGDSGSGFKLECVYQGYAMMSRKLEGNPNASLSPTTFEENVDVKETDGKKCMPKVKWALVPVQKKSSVDSLRLCVFGENSAEVVNMREVPKT